MHTLALGLCILDIKALVEFNKARNSNLQARLQITNTENVSKNLCVVRALLPDDRSVSRHGVH